MQVRINTKFMEPSLAIQPQVILLPLKLLPSLTVHALYTTLVLGSLSMS